MKPTLLVITGPLAAMKSSFAKAISTHLSCPCFLKDEQKEFLYKQRKKPLTVEVNRQLSYDAVAMIIHDAIKALASSDVVIIEANFKPNELMIIATQCEKNDINMMVFELFADVDVLYERYLKREPHRHIVHQSLTPMSKETFLNMIIEHRVEIPTYRFDTSDWEIVGFNETLEVLSKLINRKS